MAEFSMKVDLTTVPLCQLIQWALQDACWSYREIVRRRMGLPDTEEAMRKVLDLPEEALTEFLSNDELERYRQYFVLQRLWSTDYMF